MAVREGWITATEPIADVQVQPASLDLRLGGEAYQLRASFLPGAQTVLARLRQTDSVDDLVIDRISLNPAATLQPRSV